MGNLPGRLGIDGADCYRGAMRKSIISAVVAAVAALTVMFVFSSSAGAVDPNGAYFANDVTTTTVGSDTDDPIILSKTDDSDSMVLSSGDERAESQSVGINKLPFTGGYSALLAGIGLVAVAIGGSVLILRRRIAA